MKLIDSIFFEIFCYINGHTHTWTDRQMQSKKPRHARHGRGLRGLKIPVDITRQSISVKACDFRYIEGSRVGFIGRETN